MVTISAFCFSAAKSGLKIYYPALDFIFPLQFFNNLISALLVYFSWWNPIWFPLQIKLVTIEGSILAGNFGFNLFPTQLYSHAFLYHLEVVSLLGQRL